MDFSPRKGQNDPSGGYYQAGDLNRPFKYLAGRTIVLKDRLRNMGVVGAGGAGFPTSVKADCEAEYILANGAECEPLIHKDAELMTHFPQEITGGMQAMLAATGAKNGIFGVKAKNKHAIDSLKPHLKNASIELLEMGDFYPAGDEYELVHLATGRLIPPAGLPLHVGCVVNNVETLHNVYQASQGKPVTHKFLSVVGAVNRACSFWVPIGTSFRELIEWAGGTTIDPFAVFVSGLMMGTLNNDLDDVVTKTTAGLIVLPADHYLVTRGNRTEESQDKIGKSACDQCSYCTEICPRYLMGYEIEPHKVMRSLVFSATGADNWNQWAELCCACGLCTLYACPEDLYPREACLGAKTDMREAGIKFVQKKEVRLHPMKEYRRVPLSQLRHRLRVEEYEREAPYEKAQPKPRRVSIKLSQHVGAPAEPTLKVGDKVECGTLIGQVPEGKLGANIHSSIAGVVEEIAGGRVVIKAT
jgi:cobalamin reductase